MGEGAWWATVHGVAKSPTRLSDLTFTFKAYESCQGFDMANYISSCTEGTTTTKKIAAKWSYW